MTVLTTTQKVTRSNSGREIDRERERGGETDRQTDRQRAATYSYVQTCQMQSNTTAVTRALGQRCRPRGFGSVRLRNLDMEYGIQCPDSGDPESRPDQDDSQDLVGTSLSKDTSLVKICMNILSFCSRDMRCSVEAACSVEE